MSTFNVGDWVKCTCCNTAGVVIYIHKNQIEVKFGRDDTISLRQIFCERLTPEEQVEVKLLGDLKDV